MNNLGTTSQTAYGVYTPMSQFNFNRDYLLRLGFTVNDIDTLTHCLNCGVRVTMSNLQRFLDFQSAKKIKYMYDICTGKVQVETTDELCRHLRKMFGDKKRLGIQDLTPSTIKEIPRKAVIAGIKQEPFTIYNSENYRSNYDKLYDVEKVGSTNIKVVTKRKPVLRYGQSKEVQGVIKIRELDKDGKVHIEVNRKNSLLCNRFVVVASLRYPEFYHSMVEVICIEGTKVYIFAKSMGTSNRIGYSNGTQRVYDYGIFKNEIEPKVMEVATMIYSKICGVYAVKHPGNQDYNVMIKDTIETDEDYIED